MSDAPEFSATEPPAALLAEWRAAEERLYPVVMVIPEAYERVVRLVGETTVELQLSTPDVASLVRAAPGVADRVRQLAEARGYADNLDFPLIAGAACLMRYRQLEAESGRDQRRRLIEGAVAAGESWVTLAEGRPPTTFPPMPSTTLEMHVASGRALGQTIAMDDTTGAPRFVLAELQLDRTTGELTDDAVVDETFSDRHAWQAATASKRESIEGRR
jgi:hypothetical protein